MSERNMISNIEFGALHLESDLSKAIIAWDGQINTRNPRREPAMTSREPCAQMNRKARGLVSAKVSSTILSTDLT